MSGGPSSDGPAPTLPGTGKVSHDVPTPLQPLHAPTAVINVRVAAPSACRLGCRAPSSARLQYVGLPRQCVTRTGVCVQVEDGSGFFPVTVNLSLKADSKEPFLQMAQPPLPCDGQGLISQGPATNLSLCLSRYSHSG